ncbi:hypothetical protein BH23CHL8_BH23CHL8_03330 [soil metagenome]
MLLLAFTASLLIVSTVVVMAADPVGTPNASSSPTVAIPAPERIDLDWQVAVPAATARREGIEQVVAWAGGFAAYGRGPRFTTRISVSADGFTWEHRPLGLQPARERILTAHRDGLALVGTTYDESGRTVRVRVWMSPDGQRWRRVTDDSSVLGPPRADRDCQLFLTGAESVGGRLLIVGDYCLRRCCGRVGATFLAAAAQGAMKRRTDVRGGVFAWSTADGRRWRRDRVRGVSSYLWGIAKGPHGLLAVTHTGGGESVVASPDGVRWRRLTEGPAGDCCRLAATAGGPVASTSDWEDDHSGSLWTLDGAEDPADGVTGDWTLRQESHGRSFGAIDADDANVVVGAYRWPRHGGTEVVGTEVVGVLGDGEPGGPLLLVSLDGGATWAESDATPALSDACVSDVAVARGVIVAALGCRETETPQLIAARIPNSSAAGAR